MNTTTIELATVARLARKDIQAATADLTDDLARYLVDYYYISQDDRKRAHSQERALDESGEPAAVIRWLGAQAATLEDQIKRVLDAYTTQHIMGSWMRNIHGVGPVIAAGLLAHIDITRAPTVGHIWRYAGLDPTVTWANLVSLGISGGLVPCPAALAAAMACSLVIPGGNILPITPPKMRSVARPRTRGPTDESATETTDATIRSATFSL